MTDLICLSLSTEEVRYKKAKVSDKGVKSNVKVHSLLYLQPSILLYTRKTMAYAGVGKQKTKAGNKNVCDEVGEQEG